jgi:hypothetical protein
MNIEESLIHLFASDVKEIKFGVPPEKPDIFYMQCTQGIRTGPDGNNAVINHQSVDTTIVGAFRKMLVQVKAANGIRVDGDASIEAPKRN